MKRLVLVVVLVLLVGSVMAEEGDTVLNLGISLLTSKDEGIISMQKINGNFINHDLRIAELEKKIKELEEDIASIRRFFIPNCEVNTIPEDIIGEPRESKWDF